MQRTLEFFVFQTAHSLHQLVPGQNQFRHRRHQCFKHIDADTDGLLDTRTAFMVVVVAALQFRHGRMQGFFLAHVRRDQADCRRCRRGHPSIDIGIHEGRFQLRGGDFARPQFAAQFGIEIAHPEMFGIVGGRGRSRIHRRIDIGALKSGFQIRQGNLAWTQLATQVVVPVLRRGRLGFSFRLAGNNHIAHRRVFETADQRAVFTSGFGARIFQRFQQSLDLVDRL